MSHFVMYLIVMFDNISLGLSWLIGISTAFMGISLILKLIFEPIVKADITVPHKDKEEIKRAAVIAMRWFKPSLIFLVVTIILDMFTPSTKEAAVIVVVPKVINAVSENEGLKKMPDNLILLTNEWMDELRPKNVKKQVKDAAHKVGGQVKDAVSEKIKEVTE